MNLKEFFENTSSIAYIVMFESEWQSKSIAKIFTSAHAAENYIYDAEASNSGTTYWFEAWPVEKGYVL